MKSIVKNDLSALKYYFVFFLLGLCHNLISSKMKSLKYLNLNFEPYTCGCNHGLYRVLIPNSVGKILSLLV